MALRSAGARFPYRYPPGSRSGLDKLVGGVGVVLRALGKALDEFGSIIQGPAAVKETLGPNLAWAPLKHLPDAPPGKGMVTQVSSTRRAMGDARVVMPVKDRDVFIAPNANVLGDVKIGARSSIWYGAVLRGDVGSIEIGRNTSIQDNCILHVAKYSIDGKPAPTIIGDNVTVGAGAIVHAATIGNGCLIGMGATVLDGAKVGDGAIVAAGAVVTPRTVVPSGQVWAGSPARFLRQVERDETEFINQTAESSNELANVHKFENGKVFEELLVEARIEVDRHHASDPINTIHQMYELDSQTLLAVKSKK